MAISRIENHYQREKIILDHAEVMFEKGGIYSISMPELSRIASCSTNTMYSHFKCREDILVGIFNRYCAKWYVMAGRLISQSPGGFAERFAAKMILAPYLLTKEIEVCGTQFIMDLPIIWNIASPERVLITRTLLELTAIENFNFTNVARNFGLINASDAVIHKVLRRCFVLERGFCNLANNKVFREHILEEPFSDHIEQIKNEMKGLNWNFDVLSISAEEILKIIDSVILEINIIDPDKIIQQLQNSGEC
ncbi:TetR/AcrR family transcriptional regulator [Shewanella fodinae]|uniref:TetR family transcriptional regulator n=1 Tax=Shewanella fodinae TaxID=552357 RepID=A0A4R2FMN6_9GAMM|nr:TetR/AcrR family transcriptional regulator [Shewanella fodinae]TCN90533.1 TetR family transcriptional regulator [Shewanella fodinae]